MSVYNSVLFVALAFALLVTALWDGLLGYLLFKLMI
jgi:hypothetical protein